MWLIDYLLRAAGQVVDFFSGWFWESKDKSVNFTPRVYQTTAPSFANVFTNIAKTATTLTTDYLVRIGVLRKDTADNINVVVHGYLDGDDKLRIAFEDKVIQAGIPIVAQILIERRERLEAAERTRMLIQDAIGLTNALFDKAEQLAQKALLKAKQDIGAGTQDGIDILKLLATDPIGAIVYALQEVLLPVLFYWLAYGLTEANVDIGKPPELNTATVKASLVKKAK